MEQDNLGSQDRVLTVLQKYQNPRSKGTNSRKRKTNPRAKGTNKRTNEFLESLLAIVRIKENRDLKESEVQQFIDATIQYFVGKYEEIKEKKSE
jgi:hypothetical protein